MKKSTLWAVCVTVILLFGFHQVGWGQQALYEDFNYTVPGFIGGNTGAVGATSNNWVTHSVTTGQTTTIDVLAGNLSYTGLATSSGNKAFTFGNANATSRDINRAFTLTGTPTAMYYSALINIVDNTQLGATNPDYFMSFGATAGSAVTTLGGRLGIKSVNTAANYRLSIQNISTGTPTFTEFALDLNFGTTYLVVVKYDYSTTPDIASLWVNPISLGGSEPVGSVTNNSGTSASFNAFASICIRNNATTPKAEIDEIRVGNTWADVTTVGSLSAPLVQALNITFSNIVQTQMDVAWTNGDGAKRIVKINTSNTFTAPVNGTDPTANTVYGGSGEQVVYNGTDNNVPTVSGLTSGVTYWFKVFEYNGTGAGTLYCTAIGANNPKSQATSATATAPLIDNPTATAVTSSTAILGGEVTATGGSPITERGTVWSITSPVTASSNKLAEGGITIGVFTHTRTGLPANTLIYYAAYAKNAIGTTLSPEASITTLLGEPTNHASGFTATSPNYSSVTVTWADNDGTQPATGFVILANTTGTFTAPADGVAITYDASLADGSGAVTVNHGTQTFTWYSLNSSTPYYFAIYPYTNSALNIDYKTTPAAPTTSVTTQVYIAPLAAWTFDATLPKPGTPTSVASNVGTGVLYADGTNGSSLWDQATELDAFSGTLINDPREGATAIAGVSYCPLGGTLNAANGKSMVLKFSMTNQQDPILTFATRGTSTGFSTHQWAWSTDGTTFTDFGTNTANVTTSFLTRTLDMSAINALDLAANVYLRVTFSGATTATGNNRLDNIVLRATASATTTLNLSSVLLEGLYNGAGTLKQAYDELGGPHFTAPTADQITVELHNAANYATIEYTASDVNLSTSGTATVSVPSSYNASYYITIKHRNSVETTTAAAVSFAGGTINQSFGNPANVFAGNLGLTLDSYYVIYAGDVNQDGAIDSGDFTPVDNDAFNYVSGYLATDVNGDGAIDSGDFTSIDNNGFNYIGTAHP